MKSKWKIDNVLVAAIFIFTVQNSVKSEDKWVWSKEKNSDIASQLENAKISVAKPVLDDGDLQGSDTKLKSDIDRLLRDLDDDDDRAYEVKKARYEVNEKAYGYERPYRYPKGPTTAPFKYRPKPHFEENLPLPSDFNHRGPPPPPPGAVGILTGPIPSWEKPVVHKNGDPTSFETCKCSFSFNCRSPGIKFGSCDQGKEYCCYNEELPDHHEDSAIDRYDGSGPPPILIGPGGPTGTILPPKPGLKPYNPLLPPPPPLPPVPLPPIKPPYGPLRPTPYDTIDRSDEDRRPSPFPQRPVLPPYTGLHNDYRSS